MWAQNISISLADSVKDKAIANQSAVHKNVDGVAIELLQFRLRDEAADTQEARLGRGIVLVTPPWRWLRQSGAVKGTFRGHRKQLVQRLAAEDLKNALFRPPDRRSNQQSMCRRMQFKMLVWMRQRIMCNERSYM